MSHTLVIMISDPIAEVLCSEFMDLAQSRHVWVQVPTDLGPAKESE